MSLFAVRNYYPKSLWMRPGAVYTSHFWSLAVEEHFYLIIPLVLVYASKQWRITVLSLLYFVSFCWGRLALHWQLTDNRTDVSWELLMLPSLIAVILYTRSVPPLKTRRIIIGSLVTVLACLLFVTFRFLHGRAASPLVHLLIVSCVFGTALIPTSLPSRMLETAPFRFVGRISYSLYLWQQLFCRTPDPRAASHGLLVLQRAPYNLIATFCCALLSYHLIEKPMIKLGHRLAPSPSSARKNAGVTSLQSSVGAA